MKTGMRNVMLETMLVFLLIANVGYADLTDGLVAYWSFNDSSNPYHDDSGNGHDGSTAVGSPTWIDKAMSFDGNDGIDVGSFEFGLSDSFSVFVKFKAPQIQASRQIMGYSAGGGHIGSAFIIGVSPSPISISPGRVATLLGDNSLTETFLKSENIYDDMDWHSVLVIRNTNEDKYELYVDTEYISTTDNTNTIISISRLQIGCMYDGNHGSGWDPFTGMIDEVRIYNRALSEAEIQALMTGGPTP